MSGQGHQIFVDELARFAAGHVDPPVTAIARRTAAPLRVVVRGRPGVGCRTVRRALDGAGRAAGIAVQHPATDGDADVVVYALAEVVKPEDAWAIAAAERPVLAVLTKADLAGSLSGRGGDGPVAAARTKCTQLSALIGAPMEPMTGLLAVAALNDLDSTLWTALSTLAAHPGGTTCFDGSFAGFLAADTPVPTEVRQRLLDTLDLFGAALAVAALRQGRTPAQVLTLLHRMSGVEAVVARIGVMGAKARYQRVLDAVAELEALAVGGGRLGERISGFLSRDDTVVARMAAAVDLAEAAGLDPGGRQPLGAHRDPSAHLPRAVRWQRYSRASASELHRACGADIARGSLRLWSQACASLPGETW
ncbi:hypothetical protein MMAN_36920 [Mycobacterium mantenii]|uniref:Uncharacterized protein n=1 Tax=Mycobacterium mantenii TaxID=560555 RepID=A0A1X0FJJ7_MYCNT|nr:hypothetical protein [Mycobacterium mantenii]MCV7242408.1 hypothetical protein [Mycobacterium mantenii]ORB01825.1 hypothetical protein BST30_20820 [Mycobacterium mantenii]BBY39558.1 hypothetical protein MMAN_36920 [Mycobacterium mantenii]